ncbi:MAG: Gfo/Idh/MocA family oxidoreductase, partial [Candidatus Omnitrophica bacterium]|nr:Gfo/Idh/MocA family oxidoreductase [Candidatus Omnitrophota bacterium]
MQKKLSGKSILLLGAGGAARSLIAAILAHASDVHIDIVDKEEDKSVEAARIFNKNGIEKVHALKMKGLEEFIEKEDIIINLTGSGKDYDDREGDVPSLKYSLLRGKVAIDANYRFKYPGSTNEFLKKAKGAGAEIYNGLGFLVGTIPPLFKAFTGQEVNFDEMMRVATAPESEGGVGLQQAYRLDQAFIDNLARQAVGLAGQSSASEDGDQHTGNFILRRGRYVAYKNIAGLENEKEARTVGKGDVSIFRGKRDGGTANTAERIVDILRRNPSTSSEEVARELGLSREELIAGYDFIRDCPGLQDLLINHSSYQLFTREVSARLTYDMEYFSRLFDGKPVYPHILEIHLGTVCNSNCKMCFSHSIDYEERGKERVITEENLFRLLKECADNGVRQIWFSGGEEPLMSALTIKAMAKAQQSGLITRLYTNGELLSTSAREIVIECSQVRISMNAVTAETYDSIHFPGDAREAIHRRSGKGVFHKVCRNVKALVELKKKRGASVKIAVSQIIQPDNYSELYDFVSLAYGMGVDSVQIRAESVGSTRYFSEEEKQVILSQVELIKEAQSAGEYGTMELDLRGVSRSELDAVKSVSQFYPKMKKADVCRSGALKRGMNPYGAIYHCEFSAHPRSKNIAASHGLRLGNIRDGSLGEILAKNAGKFPPHCEICQAHEYGMNITFEKLQRDLDYGITLEQQPFYKKTTHILLVGLGLWGSGPVMNVLKDIPGLTIHAVAGSNYYEMKHKFGLSQNIKIYPKSEYRALLNNSDINAVIITTRVDSHYELCREALEAGKDVYMEKPFTRTVEEAERLCAIAEGRGLILAVGYEYIFDPNVIAFQKLITSGYLGGIKNIKLRMLNPSAGRKFDLSTTVIEDLSCHMLSMLYILNGKKYITDIQINSESDNERADISFNYGGINVVIRLDRDYSGQERDRTVTVIGENGTAILDYQQGTFEVFDAADNLINNGDSNFPGILKQQRHTEKTALDAVLSEFI